MVTGHEIMDFREQNVSFFEDGRLESPSATIGLIQLFSLYECTYTVTITTWPKLSDSFRD